MLKSRSLENPCFHPLHVREDVLPCFGIQATISKGSERRVPVAWNKSLRATDAAKMVGIGRGKNAEDMLICRDPTKQHLVARYDVGHAPAARSDVALYPGFQF